MAKTPPSMMAIRLLRRFLPLVLVGLFAAPTHAKKAETGWVLSASATKPIQALGRVLQETLRASPAGISLRGAVAEFKFTDASSNGHVIRLTKEAPPSTEHILIRTSHGVFSVPPALASGNRDALQEALDAVTPQTPWRQAGLGHRPLTQSREASVNVPERDRILSLRRRALELRAGRDTPASAKSPPTPLSDALAQGHIPESEVCPTCDPSLLSPDPRLRLQASRALLRTYPYEVRLWSIAADAALRTGQSKQALAYADVATRIGRPDALALHVWRQLTGEESVIPSDALMMTERAEPAPPWSMLLFIFGALALLLLASSSTRKPLVQAGWILLALVAIWAFQSTPSQNHKAELLEVPKDAPRALLAPLAGTHCEASPTLHTREGGVLYALCKARPFSFHIMSHEATSGVSTKHHRLEVRGPQQDASTDQALLRLKRSVERAEADGYRVVALSEDHAQQTHYTPTEETLEASEWSVSRTLVILALLLGLLICVCCLRELGRLRHHDRHVFWAVVGLGILTLGLNALLPDRMVMVYTGYDLTERLAMLEATPRYGAGGIWLYQPFFALFGTDHGSIQLANRIFGLLSFLPLATIVLRSATPRTSLWVLLVYVLLPLVWRDQTSEGIMAGTIWLMLSAMSAFVVGLQDRKARWLLPVGVWMAAAAATVRPEAGPALLLAGLGCWFLTDSNDKRLRFREVIFLGLAFGALLACHGMWLQESAQTQVDDASILGGGAALTVVGSVLVDQNLLLDPSLFPVTWWVWILAAFALRPQRWISPALMLLAAAGWIAMSAVDLPSVSVPRVHLPALVFLLIPMALGADLLAEKKKWLNPLVALLAVGLSLSTAPKLLASSNAQEEDALIRIAAQEITQPSSCLITLTFSDPPPPGKTQRHFPDYLFPDTTLLGLSQYESQKQTCTGDRLALLGTRCFMSLRTSETAHEPDDGELEVCKDFRSRYRLETIHEQSIPNRRDFTFAMYPARDELRVGVYRVLGANEDSSSTR